MWHSSFFQRKHSLGLCRSSGLEEAEERHFCLSQCPALTHIHALCLSVSRTSQNKATMAPMKRISPWLEKEGTVISGDGSNQC